MEGFRVSPASIDGEPAVMLSIQKQPGADTLTLTRDIFQVLDDIESRLPDEVVIATNVFKQADFIEAAIGELVDDSIVDVENIFRRLKENRHKSNPEHPLKVVFLASCEIRNSIVYATLIVVVVVFPLFSLAGLEGRMFAPLGRSRDEVADEVHNIVTEVPGVKVNIGQPISHRLDHMMSGIRAQIAVKLFGQDEDIEELRDRAQDIAEMMAEIPGVVDLQIEPQVDISQVRVTIRRREAARYGLAPADVAKALETALQGRTVSQVLEGQKTFDLVVWFDEQARNDLDAIRSTLISTPDGSRVALGTVADVIETRGPNTINRETVKRRIVVQCNAAGRDLASVVHEIQAVAEEKIQPILREGYYIEYGGQFEAKQDANRRLALLACFAVAGIFLLLFQCLRSWRAALLVMGNIPQAAIGCLVALMLVNRPSLEALAAASWSELPRVWLGASTLSVAHWVGFITVIGIVSRNGIMMISHYIHLMKYEGEVFDEKMIIRGTLERLAPVLMTALTTIIGLVPLALGAGQTGKEILHPLAIVVIGGLVSSTLLDQIVTPALFYRFGRKVYEKPGDEQDAETTSLSAPLHLAEQFDRA